MFESVPVALRLSILAGAGAALGTIVHRSAAAIGRSFQPAVDSGRPASQESRLNWLPIVGALRGQVAGRMRAIAVELAMAAVVPALYWWEVLSYSLLPGAIPSPPPAGAMTSGDIDQLLHTQFAAHVALLCFMAVASVVDLKAWVIPDSITVPGTLLGLSAAALFPWILLPGDVWLSPSGIVALEFVSLSAPNRWPASLSQGRLPALALALGAWWLWCLGLLDRRWIGRHGWRRGIGYFVGRLRRDRWTWIVLPLAVLGSLAIGLAWRFASRESWAGLVTSLAGLAIAGGMVWCVRIAGAWALKREAMGFGDVTLMSMIGAYIGWQAGLIAFFIAPLTALAIGLANWVMHREREMPFGPYLCLASAIVILFWPDFWDWGYDIFAIGWLIPVAIGVCLAALAILLSLWKWILDSLPAGEK